MNQKKGTTKICAACQNPFYVPAYRKRTAKFCCIFCQNHRQHEKYVFECSSCKKTVTTSPSRRNHKKKFCSLECRESKRKTERERRLQQKAYSIVRRGTSQGRTFRKYFFSFKEKKCDICGYEEYDFCLDLHHLDGNPQNNKIENIKVLCVICHRKVHKKIIAL